MTSDDEGDCCPLCMEELDLTDKTFDACPCGYQVCLWCWHQIKNEYNGLCPACRTPYSELSKQKPSHIDREDVVRRTKARKQKEKHDRRSAAQGRGKPTSAASKRNLSSMRVMQRNLVYVIGLPEHYAEEEMLRSNECFGQYGKITKVVVNKSHLKTDRTNATASAYVTFAANEDALTCILAIDGFILDNCQLRASFGTTKYCNFFLRNMQCNNPECLYLHELGDDEDSFTKEEMQAALQSNKAAFRQAAGAPDQSDVRAGSSFPPPKRSNSSPTQDARQDAQRKAQSAAAIHKLKQNHSMAEKTSPSATSSPSSNKSTTPPSKHASYSRIVAGEQKDETQDEKEDAHVDGNSEKQDLGPLEALKMTNGSTQKPAWAQPFPSPAVKQEKEEPDFTSFGMGFGSGLQLESTNDPWQESNQKDLSFNSFDSIFSQRNEPTETLAGLLGVELSSTPLVHGDSGSRSSRFAFATEAEENAHMSSTAYSVADAAMRPTDSSQTKPPASQPTYLSGFSSASPNLNDSFNTGLGGFGEKKENGLAFLQQMLPNVNISVGGDYDSSARHRSQSVGPFASESNNNWNQNAFSGFNGSARTPQRSMSLYGFGDGAVDAGYTGSDRRGFHGSFESAAYRDVNALVDNGA